MRKWNLRCYFSLIRWWLKKMKQKEGAFTLAFQSKSGSSSAKTNFFRAQVQTKKLYHLDKGLSILKAKLSDHHNFCNFPKQTIWQLHWLHDAIGRCEQVWKCTGFVSLKVSLLILYTTTSLKQTSTAPWMSSRRDKSESVCCFPHFVQFIVSRLQRHAKEFLERDQEGSGMQPRGGYDSRLLMPTFECGYSDQIHTLLPYT